MTIDSPGDIEIPSGVQADAKIAARPARRRRMRRNVSLTLGSAILLFWIAVAALAPLVAPHDPYAQDLGQRLWQPFWEAKSTLAHLLGTDQFGRDYLSRLIYGSRISLVIGFGAAAIAGLIGVTLGLLAGYLGGRTDTAITFLISVRLALPLILVALSLVSLTGNSLPVVITVLGLLMWDRFAVVTRTAAQQVARRDFIGASQLLGSPQWWIVLAVVLPNIANSVIVVATLEIAHAMLLEAALSFLGIGIAPPTPSLGTMISEARPFLFFQVWMIALPGLALFSLVLAVNLFGDGVRDATSPGAVAKL